jgi:hypothetical protein
MANYTSCKILVRKIDGFIILESIKKQIHRLKEENNIGQTIQVYFDLNQKCFELRFGSKWYASTINEIFRPNEFEIWVIESDEGGASDCLKHYPTEKSDENEFVEKAIYKFDELIVKGETDVIFNNLQQIFGWGINNARRWNRGEFVEIKLSGIYKSNNYFMHEYNNQMVFYEIESIPFIDEYNDRTELWEMIWDLDGIDFRNKFYQEVLNKPNGTTQFGYLKSIEFKYKGITTNKFEWKEDRESNHWSHKATNNYFNLVNTNYLICRKQ